MNQQHDFYEAQTVVQRTVTSWLNDTVANQDTAPVRAISPYTLSVDAAARVNAFIRHTPGVRVFAILDNQQIRIQELRPVEGGAWIECVTYENKRDDARLCVRASSRFIVMLALDQPN